MAEAEIAGTGAARVKEESDNAPWPCCCDGGLSLAWATFSERAGSRCVIVVVVVGVGTLATARRARWEGLRALWLSLRSGRCQDEEEEAEVCCGSD